MLVPPRINEAAAYASIRRESNMRPTRQHSPAKFLRQSFQRLSRFVDRQQGRGRAISQHPLRTSIISSETSISDSPLAWESDARSVTTFGSSETLDNDAASSEQLKATEKPSLRCVNAEKFSRFVGGKETELALSSTLQKIGVDIDQIDIHLRNGQRFSWRKQKGIIELPPVIRKEIWRKAIVHDRKLFICSCFYCQANGVVATQPPLTRASRSIRAETIPIFYQENHFQHPVSHPGNNSARGWLNSIGADNRTLLRHLELTFLNTERATTNLDVHYRMRPAQRDVVVENVMWDDGKMGEMEWIVFTGHEDGAVEVVEEDAKYVGTSILFDHGEVHDATNELEFETEDAEDEWETMSSSGESTHLLVAPSTPPQVFLTRKNGEEFGNPRWSFAGKFNDHVVRRLASLHREPPQRAARKPVPYTLMPDVVVASDRISEDGTDEVGGLGGGRLELVTEERVLPHSKRYSSGSWVMK